jgi:hypothetical protein
MPTVEPLPRKRGGGGDPRDKFYFREGLSYARGALYLPDVLPAELYLATLDELRRLAPGPRATRRKRKPA